MNIFKKRGFQIFLIGCLSGLLFVFCVEIFYSSSSFFLVKILAFPIVWGGLIGGSAILSQVCKFAEDPHWCTAGIMDGGPNDWFITLSIYIFSILFYGLVFGIIYRIYSYFKNKKLKSNKKPE